MSTPRLVHLVTLAMTASVPNELLEAHTPDQIRDTLNEKFTEAGIPAFVCEELHLHVSQGYLSVVAEHNVTEYRWRDVVEAWQ
jgi:hypothetical protein